jgi:hypothetical protein
LKPKCSKATSSQVRIDEMKLVVVFILFIFVETNGTKDPVRVQMILEKKIFFFFYHLDHKNFESFMSIESKNLHQQSFLQSHSGNKEHFFDEFWM